LQKIPGNATWPPAAASIHLRRGVARHAKAVADPRRTFVAAGADRRKPHAIKGYRPARLFPSNFVGFLTCIKVSCLRRP
jgi:hypothetical protein